jgi:hypothetical protein
MSLTKDFDAPEPLYQAALALHRHFIFGEGTITDLRCIAHFATEAFGLEHPTGERGARFARSIAKTVSAPVSAQDPSLLRLVAPMGCLMAALRGCFIEEFGPHAGAKVEPPAPESIEV